MVTGGSLSLKKSSWCLLAMKPHGTRWSFHSESSFPLILTMQDASSQPFPICRVNLQEGISVVSVVQALSGIQKPTLLALQSKANEWDGALQQGFLPCPLVWVAFRCVIWPSLQYPLAVTSFSRSQALSATGHLYQTLLPCLGVNCHFPLALRHAPVKFHGLGLPHPYWEQGLAALKPFLEFANTSRPKSILIQTSLELLQLEVGTGTLVLCADFHKWGCLATPCWLKTLWEFVSMASVELHPSRSIVPPLPCQQDGFLMDVVMQMGFSSKDLAAINHCRLSHRILFLSDLMDGWGHSLYVPLLQSPLSPSLSRWHWPQSHASSAGWQLWSQCVRWIASTMVLGDWLYLPHLSAFLPFDPLTRSAYVLQPSGLWSCYHPLHSRPSRQNCTLRFLHLVTCLPVDFSFARLHRLSGDNLLLSWHWAFSPLPPLDPFDLDPVRSISPPDTSPLEQAIRAGMALAMSDGSYMPT